jgi:hypothetical protein
MKKKHLCKSKKHTTALDDTAENNNVYNLVVNTYFPSTYTEEKNLNILCTVKLYIAEKCGLKYSSVDIHPEDAKLVKGPGSYTLRVKPFYLRAGYDSKINLIVISRGTW